MEFEKKISSARMLKIKLIFASIASLNFFSSQYLVSRTLKNSVLVINHTFVSGSRINLEYIFLKVIGKYLFLILHTQYILYWRIFLFLFNFKKPQKVILEKEIRTGTLKRKIVRLKTTSVSSYLLNYSSQSPPTTLLLHPSTQSNGNV